MVNMVKLEEIISDQKANEKKIKDIEKDNIKIKNIKNRQRITRLTRVWSTVNPQFVWSYWCQLLM